MKIRNFIHKGLKRLYTTGNVKSVPPESVDKLRKMLAFLDSMESSFRFEGKFRRRGLRVMKKAAA